jgi:hypothetical protein
VGIGGKKYFGHFTNAPPTPTSLSTKTTPFTASSSSPIQQQPKHCTNTGSRTSHCGTMCAVTS